MIHELDWHQARALLEWQLEMGATEAIGEAPVDRYALAAPAPAPVAAPAPAAAPAAASPAPPQPAAGADPVAAAEAAAAAAHDLAGLNAAVAAFTLCELRRGARSTVFAAGRPGARLMVIGDAPDRDEDRAGRPFAGPAGRLLARMFAAIGLAEDAEADTSALYLAAPIPWRPPSRAPTGDELAMMTPFLRRHVELAAPQLVVVMGDMGCEMLLGRRGAGPLRGRWAQVAGRPALVIRHPVALMRRPELKREAWADLLALKARLGEMG